MIRITSWNWNSPRFLRAPTFEWQSVRRARRYRIEIACGNPVHLRRWETTTHRADFGPVWNQLPFERIRWTITALDRHGRDLDHSALRHFVKAKSRFVPPRECADWLDCVERNVKFLLQARDHPPIAGEMVPPGSVVRNFDPRLPVYVWHAAYIEGKFLHDCAFPAMHYQWYIRLFLEYASHCQFASTRANRRQTATSPFAGRCVS